jgi:AcrR family transcriptional regulator
MSENSSSAARKLDRRVARTRDRLGDALVELLLAKPFDEITVQEVLDRAQVSRSTFYAHYRDKNDLFLSDVDQFFEGMATLLARHADRSERVAPVGELFTHVAEARDFYAVLVESGRIHDVRELGEAHFARGIEQRLEQQPRSLSKERRAALAHAFAGALFFLLSWWVRQGMRTSPREMDDLFHGMVLQGVTSRTPAEVLNAPCRTGTPLAKPFFELKGRFSH